MTAPEAKLAFRPARRHVVLLVLLILALYVLVPQLGDFRSSWHLLRHPAPGFTLAAAGFAVLTYFAAASTYCLLAPRRLPYGRTLLVQAAAMFINRLLPAGVGALGVNYLYLKQQGHTMAEAAAVIAINNPLGFLGHGLVIGLALLLGPPPAGLALDSHNGMLLTIIKTVVAAGLVVLVAGLAFGLNRLRNTLQALKRQLASYRHRLPSLVGALLTSATVTLANVLSLACCELALGVHLPFVVTLLILTLGVGTGAATPTPGGLGGFEAGLVAGFLAYGIADAPALAVVLLYRLITYWLPLGAGGLALVACQRQKLFEFPPGKHRT